MDYRAGKPVSDTGDRESDRKAEEIRGDIDRTRGQMSRTVDEIEQRLSPAHLKEQVAGLKEHIVGQYHEAKDHVKEDLTNEVRERVQHARSAVHDATVGRVQHMVHDARDTVSDAGGTILDTIKENPVPAALVALGLGWLAMSARSQGGGRRQDYRIRARSYGDEDYGYGASIYGRDEGFVYSGRDEEYGTRGGRLEGPRRAIRRGQHAVGSAVRSAEETVSNVGHRVQEGAGQVASRAGAVAHDVGERASELAHRAGDRIEHIADDARMAGRRAAYGAQREFHRAERTFEGALRDNPLAVGAIALAIGTAVGLALPGTERENQLMGGAKEKLVDKTKDLAQHAIEQVEEKVGQLTGGAEQGSGGSPGIPSSRGGSSPKNGLANGRQQGV